MSDQETAIQLIRNEAAELITRATAAGLVINIYTANAAYVVSVLVPARQQVMVSTPDGLPLRVEGYSEEELDRAGCKEFQRADDFLRMSAADQVAAHRFFVKVQK